MDELYSSAEIPTPTLARARFIFGLSPSLLSSSFPERFGDVRALDIFQEYAPYLRRSMRWFADQSTNNVVSRKGLTSFKGG